ncbi:MAG: GPP34 family phosphoprotein, partial [Bacteroidota bacterium]|nr:GPP34 family phosphoprotein [Bacteroidota bacterium]
MIHLTLAEQLLLLATDDEKGAVVLAGSGAIDYGLAGALLMELHLQKRLAWREKRLTLADNRSTGSPLVDEAMTLIAAAKKDRDAKYWVSTFSRKIPKLKVRVFDALVERGVLRKEEKKFLWVFPYKRYPESDPQPERRVRDMLQDLIEGRITPTERLLALLSLVRACDLIVEVFGKGKKREMKKRIDAFLTDDRVGKAVSDVVAEVNAAVMVAVTA